MALLELDPAIIENTSLITLYNKRVVGGEIPYTESYQIPASATIRLREVPKQELPSSVAIPGLIETTPPPGIGQFSVDYVSGVITFNAANIGSTVSISYKGKGSKVFAEDINKLSVALVPFYNKLNNIVPDLPSTQVFTFPSDIIVNGNLDVKGSTTKIESTIVTVADPVVTFNFGVTGPGNDSGVEIDRGTGNPRPNFKWIETSSKWILQGISLTNAFSLDDSGNLVVTGDVTVGKLLRAAKYTDATEATMVAGLVLADEGSNWFNTDSKQAKMWNGTSVVILG